MNPTSPAPKPNYDTPTRPSKLNPQPQSTFKYATPATLEPRTMSPSNPEHYSSAKTEAYSSISKQIKIRISEKPTKSYTENEQQYHHHNSQLSSLSNEELVNLVQSYEAQIMHLKQYLHQSDLLERNKIIQIFGFHYNCCNGASTQECKLLIKELSKKVKTLLNQNNVLKSKLPSSPIDIKADNLLIKENEKLRLIIDEYKKSEDQQYNKMRQQIYKLQLQNEHLSQTVRKYKNRIQTLEETAQYRQNKQYQKSISPIRNKPPIFSQLKIDAQPRDKSVIQSIPPIKQDFNSRQSSDAINTNRQDIQYAKKQITKQMFEFESEYKEKLLQNKEVINSLSNKIKSLEDKLLEYERQRSFIIDSTIRKSFLQSNRMEKHKGDIDVDGYEQQLFQDGSLSNLSDRREQGKIRNTNKLVTKRHQILINDDNYIEDQTPTFKRQMKKQQKVDDRIVQQMLLSHSASKQQIKLLQQRLLMQQYKNKNNLQEISMLKAKIRQYENKLQQKIERNIQLQNTISKLQNLRVSSSNVVEVEAQINTKQIQKQINVIKQTLKSCKINNFEQFFKDFNEIVKQRNYLSETIKQYKIANETLGKKTKMSKQKQQDLKQRATLLQKITQLTQQNKRLLKKISQLQAELQAYHDEVVNYELQKLNLVNLNDMSYPTGVSNEEAMRLQREIKNSIGDSIDKLGKLEKKVQNIEKEKTVKKISRITRIQ